MPKRDPSPAEPSIPSLAIPPSLKQHRNMANHDHLAQPHALLLPLNDEVVSDVLDFTREVETSVASTREQRREASRLRVRVLAQDGALRTHPPNTDNQSMLSCFAGWRASSAPWLPKRAGGMRTRRGRSPFRWPLTSSRTNYARFLSGEAWAIVHAPNREDGPPIVRRVYQTELTSRP